MKVFILNYVVDREICKPEIFHDFETALQTMIDEFLDVVEYDSFDEFRANNEECDDCYIDDWGAWINGSMNHDWQIYEMEI